MKLVSLVSAVLFATCGVSASNFLEDPMLSGRYLGENTVAIAYNASLPCGQCTRGGYTACYKGNATKCCNDQACISADATFTCATNISSQYNKLYQVCGKVQPTGCGKVQNIDLAT
jgi:hypothetical protein